MLDGMMRRIIDPPLAIVGEKLAARGLSADSVTLAGLVFGLLCSVCIVFSWDWMALAFLALGRLFDGLDGAVARATRITDRGGFLDITCDFIFYGSVPLAFALRDPALFALPSAVLLAAFYANAASFLAFSAVAAKRGMTTEAQGVKSLYFTTGLMEGTETILFFAAFILFADWYAPLAYVFAALCGLTCAARILLGWRIFGVDD
ncbi:MAG: CDP-alcohol phosphatidyltransferase family protein [Beijerinckiaceae bacterium]